MLSIDYSTHFILFVDISIIWSFAILSGVNICNRGSTSLSAVDHARVLEE